MIALAPSRKRESSRAIARQLDQFADVLAETRAELAGLEPPKSRDAQFDALVAALDESVTAGPRRRGRAADPAEAPAPRAGPAAAAPAR